MKWVFPFIATIVLTASIATMGFAQPAATQPAQARPSTRPANPPPTFSNVAYGEHPRQVMDFWKAPADKPTPLLFFIHGGGWEAGDKQGVRGVARYLAAGISVVSINYRYTWQAQAQDIKPPVAGPLHDAARALQFVRSKSSEWNIEKQRVAASGGSAGACSSLWLAFHDDLADPKAADPIARESTRLWCAAVEGAQTSLDPQQMKEWTPNSRYGAHAFGFSEASATHAKSQDAMFADWLAHRDDVLPWIREFSPIEHAGSGDPPIYLIFSTAPALGQPQRDPTHTSNFGVKLAEKLKSVSVECELVYPGAPDVKHASIEAFVFEKFKN